MLQIVVCDDEAPERERIALMVLQSMEKMNISCKVIRFSCGEDLIESMQQGNMYDILILDIFMGISDGISIAREIRTFDNDCPIIFVTNSKEHAIEGYGVHALQYFLKPVDQDKLQQSLNQALNHIKAKQKKYICLSNKQGSYRICINHIVYVESQARLVLIHTDDGMSYSFYQRLSHVYEELDHPCFLRCHKSYIVNMDYVRYITGNIIILEGGEQIPVSIKISDARQSFAKYIGNQI